MKVVTPVKCLLVALIGAACLVFPQKASALTMSFGNAWELGYIDSGMATGNQDKTDYLNAMSALPLGGSTVVNAGSNSNTVTRSWNDFGSLASGVFSLNGTGTTVDLGTVGYAYLLASYNSPKYGAEVWFVGDLSGPIRIPGAAGGNALSGWTLFTPGQTVPEGGTTVALLGVALCGLGAARRLIKR